MRSLVLVLLSAASAWGGPPVVTVPAEVSGDVATFVTVKATVKEGKAVRFMSLDAGLSVFPSSLLSDPTATVVVASKPGKYRVLAYSGNADGPSDPVLTVVVIGVVNPPVPVDPVDPVEPADAAPIKAPGFRVLMVYDSQTLATMPPARLAILTSGDVRAYAAEKCVLGEDGRTREFRVMAATQDVSGESKVWKEAMALKRTSLPWIVVSNGKAGYSGPLPGSVADTMTLMRKYGGAN